MRWNHQALFDPWTQLESFAREVDRWMNAPVGDHLEGRPLEGSLSVRVEETDDAYHLQAPVPGVDPTRLHVSLEGNRLELRVDPVEADTPEGEPWLARHTETRVRRLTLPGNVQADGVKAALKNGLLTVTVAKVKPEGPRRIDVTHN